MTMNFTMCEVEIHSLCNRRCSFCPNVEHYRDYEEMPVDTFRRLMQDLNTAGYLGAVSFSRYNEPMARLEMLKQYIGIGKECLPDCKFVTNTNGDYLCLEVFDTGVDELSIMDYDYRGLGYCIDKLIELGVEIDRITENYIAGHKNGTLVRYEYNWEGIIIDRAGTVVVEKPEARDRGCSDPSTSIVVDVNGSVMPCCNMRNDLHGDYVLGNINKDSIIDILGSEKAVAFRDAVMRGELPEPCTYCQKVPGRYVEGHRGIYH